MQVRKEYLTRSEIMLTKEEVKNEVTFEWKTFDKDKLDLPKDQYACVTWLPTQFRGKRGPIYVKYIMGTTDPKKKRMWKQGW